MNCRDAMLFYMIKLSAQDGEKILKKAGFRITEHRLAVLRTVAGSKQALTVQALFDLLRNKYVIDQATVYRNLASLEEARILRRLDFNHGHAHYELETGEPSYKIICGECETIDNLDGTSFSEVMKKLIKKSSKFKKIHSHSVEIYGTCKNCAS